MDFINKYTYFKSNISPMSEQEQQHEIVGDALMIEEDYRKNLYVCAHKVDHGYSSQFDQFFHLCLICSTVCLALLIIAYSLVPQLRNVPGKCLMSLSYCLFIWNLSLILKIFIIKNGYNYVLPKFCYFFAIFRLYFTYSYFIWSVVISFNIFVGFYYNFPNIASYGHRDELFRHYSYFVWTFSAILIVVLIILDNVLKEESNFKPHFFGPFCDINKCEPFIIYKIFFAMFIITFNSILFALVIRKYLRAKTEAELPNRISMHDQLVFITKLMIILGLPIAFGLITHFFPILDGNIIRISQGTFIFVAFTCVGNSRKRIAHKIGMILFNLNNRNSTSG